MVIEEINNAIKELSINEIEFRKLEDNDAEPLFHELLNYFVEGGDRRWWWESFKKTSKSIHFSDSKGFERITEVVPNIKESVWFVVEDDQLPYYPIYETTPEIIKKIIGSCFAFEYYIIPKSKEWLLCENHHNNLIGIGKTIMGKLAKLSA